MAKYRKISDGTPPPFLKNIYLVDRESNDFASYPLSIPIFQDKDFKLEFEKPVTIIVGENGSGKSTLLEAIAQLAGFNVLGGSQNHTNFTNEKSALASFVRLSWRPKINSGFFVRAESMFQLLRTIDNIAEESGGDIYEAYGGKSLAQRSHGEAFLTLFESRLDRPGIYILDEPEAALSPQRQIEFLRTIRRVEKTGKAQVIIATHSPMVAAYPGAQLLVIKDGCVQEEEFHNLEHYKTMMNFFYNPDGFMAGILYDESDEDWES